jgi:hypothetical protein
MRDCWTRVQCLRLATAILASSTALSLLAKQRGPPRAARTQRAIPPSPRPAPSQRRARTFRKHPAVLCAPQSSAHPALHRPSKTFGGAGPRSAGESRWSQSVNKTYTEIGKRRLEQIGPVRGRSAMRRHASLVLVLLAVQCGSGRRVSDSPADSASVESWAPCSVSDMEALEALFAATAGESWRCGAPGRPCRQVDAPVGVAGAASLPEGEMGVAWPFGLSIPWRDARFRPAPPAPACSSPNGNAPPPRGPGRTSGPRPR